VANVSDLILDPLPPKDAIEYFKGKVPLKPADFSAIQDEYQSLAFTVSGINALDVLTDIYNELQKSLTDGTTIDEFRKNTNALLERRGYSGLTPYRLDNVYRTNIMTALNVGRYRQMTDPDVMTARPVWQYDAIDDSHTRPTHLALNGRAFPADNPFWLTWYPPNGYRCRCGVVSLSTAQAKRKGLTVETKIPTSVPINGGMNHQQLLPDPGFGYNPAKVTWQPDLSKYPEKLKKAFLERLKTV
jgi:SPP1 gp7 family putative phage head morphogenesis protein